MASDYKVVRVLLPPFYNYANLLIMLNYLMLYIYAGVLVAWKPSEGF